MSFNAVQNNTSLKPGMSAEAQETSFNAVQNNTSLKQEYTPGVHTTSFNAVQNNTSLKLASILTNSQKVLMQFKITHL